MDKKEYSTPTVKVDNSSDKAYKQRALIRAERGEYLKEKSLNRAIFADRVGTGTRVFAIMFALMLVVMLVRAVQSAGGEYNLPTFTGLIETLRDVPSIGIPYINVSSIDLGDWWIFNFIRDWLQLLLTSINCIVFFINGIISALSFIIYLSRYLFLG